MQNSIRVPVENVTFNKGDTFKEYETSKVVHRGFCVNCGSTMGFRNEKYPSYVGFCTGTLNQEFLVNPEGAELCLPKGGRFFCSRDIPGVTSPDGMYGGGPDEDIAGKRYHETSGW